MTGPDGVPRFERTPKQGTLADLGCPECPGVLSVLLEGDKGFLTFVCRIGHTFSPQSLLDQKEDGLERALWEAVERLEELACIYEEFAARAGRTNRPELAAAYRDRLDLSRSVLERLRALAQENRPASEPEPR